MNIRFKFLSSGTQYGTLNMLNAVNTCVHSKNTTLHLEQLCTVIFLLACLAQKSIRRHSIFLRSWLILHQQVHQIYTSEWKVLRNWWIFLGLKKKFSCYLFSKEYPLVYLFWNGPEQSLGKKYLSSYNNTRCFFSKINELTMRFPIVGIHLVTHAWIQYPIICIPTWKNWSKRLVVFTWNQFHEIFREIDFTKLFKWLFVFSLPPQSSTSPFTNSETAAPRPTEVTLDAIGLGQTTPPFTYNQNSLLWKS